jgi:hypothetical protein
MHILPLQLAYAVTSTEKLCSYYTVHDDASAVVTLRL